MSDNPVLSARIRALREEEVCPPEDTAAEDARVAQQAKARLDQLLRDAGETDPTVNAHADSIVGPCAVACVAGYPVIQTRDRLSVMSVPGRLTQISSLDTLAVLAAPETYEDPSDYEYLIPGDFESRLVRRVDAERERKAAAEREAAARVERENRAQFALMLREQFTPAQHDLATAEMFPGVTYHDWLAANLLSGRKYLMPSEAVELADDLIHTLRP